MNGSDRFKDTIQDFLEMYSGSSEEFARKVVNPKKNIDDCVTYILNQVRNSNCNGFEDNEIFGMAVHYYDEDNIDPGSAVQCQVVVNHTVQLTEDEKAEAHQKALQRAESEAYARMTKRSNRPALSSQKTDVSQSSLF